MPASVVTTAVLTEGLFDTVVGLPVHPLVVHAVVVLLPLSALALIVIVLVKRWRGAFGWVTLAGLAIGTGAAIVAKESGEALAERVGLPDEHASLGDRLPIIAIITLLIAIGWFVLQRRDARGPEGRRSAAQTITGVAAIIMAVATIIVTVLVGHSGAVAVWEGRIAASDAATAGSVEGESGGGSGTTTYTLADVASHSQPTDCWTVIDGTVYDLTEWVNRHPGGVNEITQTCGIDATASFEAEHAGEREPAAELAGFAIGTLGGLSSAPATGATAVITTAAIVTGRGASAGAALSQRVKRYSRAQVRRHNSSTSCWTVVNGRVYDLTGWINQHPGGAGRIVDMCGVDATAAFTAEHAGESRATSILRSFRIGRLRTA